MMQSIILVHNQASMSLHTIANILKIAPPQIDSFQSIEVASPEEKQNIGIEESRKVIEWNAKKSDRFKMCIIRSAEQLTTEAQNSLLKVVEEPNSRSIIVFETQNDKALLNTIRSRCEVIMLKSEHERNTMDIKILLEKDYFGRMDLLLQIQNEKNKRITLNTLIIDLISYLLVNNDRYDDKQVLSIVIEFLKQASIANKRNVNSKLIISNINNYLEQLL